MDKTLQLLKTSRSVILGGDTQASLQAQDLKCLADFRPLILALQTAGYNREAVTISDVCTQCARSTDFGGLSVNLDTELDDAKRTEVLFLFGAWMEALNSAERSKAPLAPLDSKPAGRRPMTLTEKIFAYHDIERKGFVTLGRTMSISVDWVIGSDASWHAMKRTYDELGDPGIFRNDRLWIALDHVVDPRINHRPDVNHLIELGEEAREKFKMTEYQGQNYTILHTEFYRERAQPGMIVIGSDSHTCSAGAVGCLSIGLGATDVTMAMVTGEIWFRVPEVVNIRLIGKPGLGIGGKDTILYILKELKRNTVAANRVVEYTGPGLKYLSIDARFAIANMTTEFGGITGVFTPDEVTYDFIHARKSPRHKHASVYFQPDEDAEYAETCEIDLSKVTPFVARYPNPDDVVPITEWSGKELDGCFIGACTTAEEDILLGALVLKQGLKMGKKPVSKGKRKVVPGSRPILNKLETSGLADVYRAAGFEIGIPGCSYCVGMSADQAGEGEVWLSSQNRNFENRMGKGSIGNLASSATVAASSFDMKGTDPSPLIAQIDMDRFNELRARKVSSDSSPVRNLKYVEPAGEASTEGESNASVAKETATIDDAKASAPSKDIIRGKISRLGDYIDTDALAPAQYLVTTKCNADIAPHCLERTHPDFRSRVAQGYNIVVAGKAFGCGSSRQEAVMALLGCGIQAVIAPSFAFIYSRNQPSLGLVGIVISDPTFYELATDGEPVAVDLDRNVATVQNREFSFEFSEMEKKLMDLGGIVQAFEKYGKEMFRRMCAPKSKVFDRAKAGSVALQGEGKKEELAW